MFRSFLCGLYMDYKKVAKVADIFCCKICDYSCSKQSNYDKHILTAKHQRMTNGLQMDDKKLPEYSCLCGSKYKYRQGLSKHKKNCDYKPPEMEETNLIIQLLKQNQELQKSLIELSKEKSIVTNSHNKTFNLQLFLNEQCKDAINLSDFVSSIKMDLSDLETTGRLGYVEGVSRIINKNLNKLEVCKRPIHCSDLKRETLYIKNDDEWKKETEDNIEIKKAIKDVANENIKQIGQWRKEHPGCSEADSNKNDTYLKIVSNAMSGATREEQMTNYEKIVSKIAKEVVIVK